MCIWFIFLENIFYCMTKKKIAIAGAGISGMSTACILMQNGYEVTIYAKSFFPDITSNKAAAFWFPYHIRNDKRGIEWCRTSYDHYLELAKDPSTGISIQQLLKIVRKGVDEAQTTWIDFMPSGSYRLMTGAETAAEFEKVYDITVPLIETQLFLPWLKNHLEKNNVGFIHQTIDDLQQLNKDYDFVVNCTGLGARGLCNDRELIPVRGQVALLSPGKNLSIYLDNEKPLYVVPRKDAIIVGGTYEESIDVEITEPETIKRILTTAYEALPLLKSQTVIGSWAGLRPYRKDVRVEMDSEGKIIHNYGHGGSGFTLAFGCANTVLRMIKQAN